MASPVEDLYREVFGLLPKKSGEAYERLAAIALHLIAGGSVVHDDKLRGQFSQTLYQIDAHHRGGDGTSRMAEAKDYSEAERKVGRPDLQKLGGALPDLATIDAGAFFSATGYTRPAKKYADTASQIVGKPIALYELRPTVTEDHEGIVKTIVLRMHISTPDLANSQWQPHITAAGQSALKHLLPEGSELRQLETGLSEFFDEAGASILTLRELTSRGYGDEHELTGASQGCFVLPGLHIEIGGVLAEISGLEYSVPYVKEVREIRITDDSECRFALLDGEGKTLKLLSDKSLQQYSFDEAGNLIQGG
jgi:hypothetical protein